MLQVQMGWWESTSSWSVRTTWSFEASTTGTLRPGWTAVSVRSSALWPCCPLKYRSCFSPISLWRNTSASSTHLNTWHLAGDELSLSFLVFGCLASLLLSCHWPVRVYFATSMGPMVFASRCIQSSLRHCGPMFTPSSFSWVGDLIFLFTCSLTLTVNPDTN